MKEFAERLLRITEGCREDMHEPDEQGISAVVSGDHLDNAFGDRFGDSEEYSEYVLRLDSQELGSAYFNLATLIALARLGANTLVADIK